MRTNSNDPYFPAEMLEIYPQQIMRTGIQNVWQRSPVSLETCYTFPDGRNAATVTLDYILEQGLRWHVGTANIKSAPIPSNGKPSLTTSKERWDIASSCVVWNTRKS